MCSTSAGDEILNPETPQTTLTRKNPNDDVNESDVIPPSVQVPPSVLSTNSQVPRDSQLRNSLNSSPLYTSILLPYIRELFRPHLRKKAARRLECGLGKWGLKLYGFWEAMLVGCEEVYLEELEDEGSFSRIFFLHFSVESFFYYYTTLI